MIKIKNLTKQYSDKMAVKNLSFTVKDGEILGFLGPNGAGKSTTMNILTGYLSATSGEVIVDGIDITESPEQAKKAIGYLPEIPPLYTDMTVEEYLRFMFRLKKVGKSVNREQHIAEICDMVYLREVKKRLIKNLSKGYKQRVGIAQALIGDPKILILDEPTVGLDPKQIIEIRSLIKKLGEKHTIIFSSHILQEIQAVCTRVLIINEGQLIVDDITPEGSRSIGYQVLVEGPKANVMYCLKKLTGVTDVQFRGNEEPNVGVYIVKTESDIPVRRSIYDCISQNGWRLLGLEKKEENLEELFLRATTGRKILTEKEDRV